jgi:hypothetical protein
MFPGIRHFQVERALGLVGSFVLVREFSVYLWYNRQNSVCALKHRTRIEGLQLISGRESDGRGLPLIREPFLESDLRRVMSETDGLC